jgi:hypothetical protein
MIEISQTALIAGVASLLFIGFVLGALVTMLIFIR